jgi:hypothetical protein
MIKSETCVRVSYDILHIRTNAVGLHDISAFSGALNESFYYYIIICMYCMYAYILCMNTPQESFSLGVP